MKRKNERLIFNMDILMEEALNKGYIIKKDNSRQKLNLDKIIKATEKSAERVMVEFSNDEKDTIRKLSLWYITDYFNKNDTFEIPISYIHKIVEEVLTEVNTKVCVSYKDYRNYKTDFVKILDKVYNKSEELRYLADKSNGNTDSSIVSTKRSITYKYLNKELYQKFNLNSNEREAIQDGYIYIHDIGDRRDTINCCLFDMETVLKGGFEMSNLWYNEPKSLNTAFDVISDVTLNVASQQYGGFTIPEMDKILKPYAEKSFKNYQDEYVDIIRNEDCLLDDEEFDYYKANSTFIENRDRYAYNKVKRDFQQGFQGWEMKFNSVSSSRGDFPFITITLGLGTSKFEKLCNEVCFEVRKKGQGKKDHKKPVLFPKIVFLYDEELHGTNKPDENIFDYAIDCSSTCMYPDYLSLTSDDPNNTVCVMYKKYKKVISPMGCRAFLSPYYERGGFQPEDENDEPIFVGRFNMGVVSLNLIMILAKAREEGKDFYEVLDYYMEMIRHISKKTIAYLGKLKASIDPVAFTQGGFYKGFLKPDDCIEPLLKYATISFGYTGLNELQELYNKKSIREDGEFALKVMKYINNKVNQYKKEDHILYAIYATPGESLCSTQIEQFRKKYGIIKRVSDRSYVSNSFHCHVTEDITPFEKQDKEYRFWNLSSGGRIQYCKYPIKYNTVAVKTLVKRAMKMGLYEGVNLSLSYCNDCGEEFLKGDECPKCSSKNLTKIERMNGYLSYTRLNEDPNSTRMNKGKMEEIADRVSM